MLIKSQVGKESVLVYSAVVDFDAASKSLVNKPTPLVYMVHWVGVWSDSPGEDKGLANLLSCRQWGTIGNLLSLYNFLRP